MAEHQQPANSEELTQQEEYSQLVAIRREKLKALQDAGQRPLPAHQLAPAAIFA